MLWVVKRGEILLCHRTTGTTTLAPEKLIG
jgi:hypothetical protein